MFTRQSSSPDLPLPSRQVGDPSQLSALRSDTSDLHQLCSELQHLTSNQTADIQHLTTATLDLASTIEEARALHLRSKDPRLVSLLRMRPLEPSVARRVKEIRASWQYMESQLTAAGLVLDQRWAELLESRKGDKMG